MNNYKKFALLFCLFVFLPLTSLYSQVTLQASKAKYPESSLTKANTQGIYPVELKLTVLTNDQTFYIKIYRSETKTGPYEMIIDTMQPNEEYFNLYDTETTVPGTKYYYKAVYGKGENQIESNIDDGWGALTHETLYIYCNQLIDKSFKRINLMKNKKNIDKLGKEDVIGLSSGILHYYTQLKGTSGVVTVEYDNYSDNTPVIFNGAIITKANIMASGTMSGELNITGMYTGKINYDKVIIKDAKAAGGTYVITPLNQKSKDVDYTLSFVGIE